MFKKGITGKDAERMTGRHLGSEPKKKKIIIIKANQVCSSENTPTARDAPDGNMGTAGVPQPSLGNIVVGTRGQDSGERVMACQLAQLCHTPRKKKTQTRSTPDPNSESQHILCIRVFLRAPSHPVYLKQFHNVPPASSCSPLACLQKLPHCCRVLVGRGGWGAPGFPLAGLLVNVPGDCLCHLD